MAIHLILAAHHTHQPTGAPFGLVAVVVAFAFLIGRKSKGGKGKR